MFSLTVLGSGSAGNSALVVTGGCRLLIDSGLSARQIVHRLAALGISPAELDGVILTHEHGDHTRGLEILCRHFALPIHCTRSTGEALRHGSDPESSLRAHTNWRYFTAGSEFEIADVTIQSFPVPHDAVDPVGFVLCAHAAALGFLTDLGHATKLAVERVRAVSTLVIESNHDNALLSADPNRPWPVKQRIMSRHGHLSNEAAAGVVAQILDAGGGCLSRVVLGHLSRDCNRPQLALDAVRAGLRGAVLEIHCATQSEVSARFAINPPAPPAPRVACIAERLSPQRDLFAETAV